MKAEISRTMVSLLAGVALLVGCRDVAGPAPIASLEVTAPAGNLSVGDTMQASVIAVDASGSVLTGRNIAWTSSDSSIATVSAAGMVRGVTPGEVVITAEAEGRTGDLLVTVTPALTFGVTIHRVRDHLAVGPAGRTVDWCEIRGSASGATHLTYRFTSPAGFSTPLREHHLGGGDEAFEIIDRCDFDILEITAHHGEAGAHTDFIYLPRLAIPVVEVLAPPREERFVSPGTMEIELDLHVAAPRSGSLSRIEIQVADGPREPIAASGADARFQWPARLVGDVTPLWVHLESAAGHRLSYSIPIVRVPGSAIPGQYAGVATADAYSCAIDDGGALYCWGYDYYGTFEPTVVPTRVHSGSRFESLAAATSSICGLDTEGLASCWGYNPYGLGDGSSHRTAPARVAGGIRFTTIDAGAYTVCGISMDQRAYCWGTTPASSPVPELLDPALTFTDISVQTWVNVCALSTDGAVYCWADVGHAPTRVDNEERFVSIARSGAGLCALTEAGEPWCWDGRIPPDALPDRLQPLATNVRFTAIHAAPGDLICGVTEEGWAYCWQSDGAPELVSDEIRFRSLAIERGHSCGVATNGAIYCWGRGELGQLGNRTSYTLARPTRVVDVAQIQD